MINTQRRRRGAFSLIELLVVLVILIVISVFLAGAILSWDAGTGAESDVSGGGSDLFLILLSIAVLCGGGYGLFRLTLRLVRGRGSKKP